MVVMYSCIYMHPNSHLTVFTVEGREVRYEMHTHISCMHTHVYIKSRATFQTPWCFKTCMCIIMCVFVHIHTRIHAYELTGDMAKLVAQRASEPCMHVYA